MSRKPSTVPSRGPTGRGAHSGHERLAAGLGWFSIGLGLAEIFAARALCRTLGFKGQETLVRAYGVREVATGVSILMSHDPTPWIWGRVGGDALDLATLGAGFGPENGKAGNLAIATAAVAGVTALDILCAQGLTADKRLSPPGAYDYGDRVGFPRSAAGMRGMAADFRVPDDFRPPVALRPWTESRPGAIADRA